MIDGLARWYGFGPAPADRPLVVMSMIASVDGGTAVDGRSGGLGHPTDKAVFRLARAAADVVLVGAQTVRAERYRPLPEPKLLAVVSGSGDLGDAPAAGAPNTVVVDGRAAAGGLAGVLATWPGRVIVCEGGPSLNGQLLAAGLVDEVLLTLSPRLVAGDSARIAHGPAAAGAEPWALRHVLEDDGFLFLRYALPGSRRSDSASVRSAGTSS